jgi:hypothetical protein
LLAKEGEFTECRGNGKEHIDKMSSERNERYCDVIYILDIKRHSTGKDDDENE